MKRYRVIVFGTGLVGGIAARSVIDHPELELVGVWVHSSDKAGRDIGDILGIGEVGVVATSDLEELLALEADCLLSAAQGTRRQEWMVDTHCRFLAAGTNIVSCSIVQSTYGPAWGRQDLAERLERSARQGNASYLTSGLDPGFTTDLALQLVQVSRNWSEIRVREVYDYSTYMPASAQEVLRDHLGFGKPIDHPTFLFQPGTLTAIWGGPCVRMMADLLDVRLSGIDEHYWRSPASRAFHVDGLGLIEEGTQEAFRFECRGLVDGKPAIVWEHITRLRQEAAPEWYTGECGEGYYVTIAGEPDISAHFSFTGSDGGHQTGAMLVTGTRLVNAIPAVCAADAGILGAPADLPFLVPQGLYKASRL